MFLDKTLERNKSLIEMATKLHKEGLIQPDTYVVDMDALRYNARKILEKAKGKNIKLYFMLKQLGRNPLIAKELVDMGYIGAVVVDFREALVMMKHGIPLGNVGHLVQTPKNLLKEILEYGTDVVTVFSYEKLVEVNDAAKSIGIKQDILIKVAGENDVFYSGQFSGIELEDFDSFIEKTKNLTNVKIVGVTAFPCFLYDYDTNEINKTNNYYTVMEAVEHLKRHNIKVEQINVPSLTCVETIDFISNGGGDTGEPGHGLTGTTPAHAYNDLVEIPSVVYLSEISHNFRGKSYAYGGGYYRRSRIESALVYENGEFNKDKVIPINNDSIDYYFELESEHKISSPVVMAFRFQIFVTRSRVVLIERSESGIPIILGEFDGLGNIYE